MKRSLISSVARVACGLWMLLPAVCLGDWPANGRAVCTASGTQQNQVMVSDGNGGAILAWEDLRDGTSHIYAQHVLLSGVVDPAWLPNGVALCTATGGQYAPRMASDGAGGAIVTWYDQRSGSDIYAQHVLASGAVDPGWTPNGTAICLATNVQQYPAIVADSVGGAIITWEDYRTGSTTGLDIYAQRVGANGIVDARWPTGGRAICTMTGGQTRPAILSDGHQGAIIAWEDSRVGSASDIYAQHVLGSSSISPGWTTNGVAICKAASTQRGISMVQDGINGAIIVWQDFRSGEFDIYAQRLESNGAVDPAWPVNGRLLCGALGQQTVPAAATDGAGGAIVTWQDARALSGEIYAQRVILNGSVAWASNGVAVCPGHVANDPAIVPDGSHGAIIAWADIRSGYYGVYAQRVRDTGALDAGWGVGGTALSTANDYQFLTPTMSTDGVGGYVVGWCGDRSGTLDVYAQHGSTHGGQGLVDVDQRASTPKLSLEAPWPNPAVGPVSLRFSLPTAGHARLSICDASGRLVRRIIDGDVAPGFHAVSWDGRDTRGARSAPGIYFARLETRTGTETRKITVIER